MATASRIDDVVIAPDGSYEIRFTCGQVPLPATWQGQGQRFASKAELIEYLDDLARRFDVQLCEDLLTALSLFRWQRLNGSLTNPALARGKTAAFDRASVAVISIT